jgi:hypothetical protein
MNIVKWAQKVSIGSVVSATALALMGTAALAYWTSSGQGNATVNAVSPDNSNPFTSDSTGNTALFPGASSTISFKVTNPNSYSVQLTGMTSWTISTDSQHSACTSAVGGTTAMVVLTSGLGPSNFGSASVLTLGPNSNKTLTSTSSVVTMDGARATNVCQGATFTVTFQGTVTSQ